MFYCLGLPNNLIKASILELGYDDIKSLSWLKPEDVEKLIDVIPKPGRKSRDERNPRMSVPMRHQDLITGACFALKHQYCTGHDFYAFIIMRAVIDYLCFQMQIKNKHDNSVDCANCPKWDTKNRAASAKAIEDFFCQLHGIEGVPCKYLMRKNVLPRTDHHNAHLTILPTGLPCQPGECIISGQEGCPCIYVHT